MAVDRVAVEAKVAELRADEPIARCRLSDDRLAMLVQRSDDHIIPEHRDLLVELKASREIIARTRNSLASTAEMLSGLLAEVDSKQRESPARADSLTERSARDTLSSRE